MGLFTLDEDLLPDSGKPYRGKPSLKLPPPERKAEEKEPVYLVTDTSWWLDQGWRDAVEIARKIPEAFFVIPAGVMRELDGLKRNPEKGRKALESTKLIHELVQMGRARIETREGKYYNALASRTDEEVVGVARTLKEEGRKVALLTTDRAQMALAEQVGVVFKKKNENSLRKFILLLYFCPIVLFPIGLFILFVSYMLKNEVLALLGGFLSYLALYWQMSPKDRRKSDRQEEKEFDEHLHYTSGGLYS